MKRRVWKRRRDGVRQRYTVGKKRKARGFFDPWKRKARGRYDPGGLFIGASEWKSNPLAKHNYPLYSYPFNRPRYPKNVLRMGPEGPNQFVILRGPILARRRKLN